MILICSNCKKLVEWLHSYSGGQTLHKRYIYAVIEKRMPKVVLSPSNTLTLTPTPTPSSITSHIHDYGSVDYLSELFGTIFTVCTEQFSIIRNIFPREIIPKMARVLIQRIYNDPAFGIQGRVDSILNPKLPQPPLPLSDYLVSLLTVSEKLSALYIILLDLCSHPLMEGTPHVV
jgi:hypothetical protein